METLKYVAQQIRDLRMSYGGGTGISQEALAKALGVATNTVSRWETGTYRPRLEDLDMLARFFGKPISEFFPRADSPVDDKITGLLRAAKQLGDSDLEELRRYAEFRRARSLYPKGERPSRGRKKKDAP